MPLLALKEKITEGRLAIMAAFSGVPIVLGEVAFDGLRLIPGAVSLIDDFLRQLTNARVKGVRQLLLTQRPQVANPRGER